ncbi:cytidine deaminase-like protein [Gymnopus androsaceus JB14]|uniref:Cytidine deaminase-like protein n=1 Tax=Gymnopus androsaceus JB14 TaxID=1447944 RepID=A0A6A4IJ83_9AGAR|nr:cytidine deaminase-like protein [Gymnopus androsaceus JB14]
MTTLSEEKKEALIKAALEGNPYSKFRVGAALLASDGSIIKGANIENASYGGTICAERTAIVKSVVSTRVVSSGYPRCKRCSISLWLCRQVIREFCSQEMPIFMVPADYPQSDKKSEGDVGKGGVKETCIGTLLPDSFGPEHLELPRGNA